MANTYEQILALVNKGNEMGLSNTIKRDYGIPLEYSSVQETYEAALDYAQNSTLAYIGQPISVGDTLYVVTDEAGGYLKAVGTMPAGDDVSIEVTDDGKISIKGFAGAGEATLPRKNADGSISWITLADIAGSTDTNTKTVVNTADGSAITVSYEYDDKTDTKTYTLDVQLPAIPEYSITKEVSEGQTTYQLVKDNEAVGEAIIVPNKYDDSALAGRVSAVEGTVATQGTTLATVKEKVDNFFAAVEQPDAVIDTLAEINKYIEDDKSGASSMAASIKQNADAIAALTGDGDGSVTKLVDDAIAAQVALDEAKYATQTALANVKATADAAAVKAEVDEALEDKADKTTLANYYTKDESYSKDAVEELIRGITADTGATASQVEAALNVHKQENVEKFAAIDTKNGEQDTAINANADAIAILNGGGEGSIQKIVADAITEIPVATTEVPGIVKSSDEITVADDGTMNIGDIPTSKIVNSLNNAIILNGGSATSDSAE